MAEVSAAQVKSLREATGMGMMECKKALVESRGDVEEAQRLLRVRGQNKAEKVAGRSTGEGRVGILVSGDAGAVVQVSCETDFVAKDENFAAFVGLVCRNVVEAGEGRHSDLPGVEEERQALVLKLGENISVTHAECLRAAAGAGLHSYTHRGDKIGVLAEIAPAGSAELGRGICMHIAAMRPQWVAPEDVPEEIAEKEREICRVQMADSGKPGDVVEKAVAGKVKKFFAGACLVGQPYVLDEDKTVGQALAGAGAAVTRFVRLEIGR